MSQTEEEPASEEDVSDAQAQAEHAADGLRGQIAAVRQKIRDAQDTLREHARRENEPKSFKR